MNASSKRQQSSHSKRCINSVSIPQSSSQNLLEFPATFEIQSFSLRKKNHTTPLSFSRRLLIRITNKASIVALGDPCKEGRRVPARLTLISRHSLVSLCLCICVYTHACGSLVTWNGISLFARPTG